MASQATSFGLPEPFVRLAYDGEATGDTTYRFDSLRTPVISSRHPLYRFTAAAKVINAMLGREGLAHEFAKVTRFTVEDIRSLFSGSADDKNKIAEADQEALSLIGNAVVDITALLATKVTDMIGFLDEELCKALDLSKTASPGTPEANLFQAIPAFITTKDASTGEMHCLAFKQFDLLIGSIGYQFTSPVGILLRYGSEATQTQDYAVLLPDLEKADALRLSIVQMNQLRNRLTDEYTTRLVASEVTEYMKLLPETVKKTN